MSEELERLRRSVERCRKCPLWKTRNNPVFGEGPADAEVMLIGLGPGYHENLEGRPFVGAAGKLLNKLLESAGLRREEVYITNVVKCYLPENKVTRDELEACTPYLDEQIELIKPKVIITLGNVAMEYAFSKFRLKQEPISRIHGRMFMASSLTLQIKIIPMYHPAAALRNPGLRTIIEEDWKNVGNQLKKLYQGKNSRL